ncbi:aldo/keto reductase, partial [Bacillus sp. S34]|nr:aldo/keto reductase [Bacillus sp. S34]
DPNRRGNSRRWIMRAVEDSLRRLQTDHIDLYQVHRNDHATPLEETVRAFDQLVQEGLVRYTAISNYSRARADEWIRIAKDNGLALPVAIEPHYNLVTREPYESDIAPLAAAEGAVA